MRLGFHVSIGGGLVKAIDQGLRTGCETVQIFSRNPRGWKSKPLDDRDVEAFRRARDAAGIHPLVIHLPYLPNLAAMDEELWTKSVAALAEEMTRADRLGAEFVVAHPGHFRPHQNPDQAANRIVDGVLGALAQGGGIPKAVFLLETTSGQRGEVGARFEDLSRIIRDVESTGPKGLRLGVCLDTAHVWAAGFDIAREIGLKSTLADFDRTIGMDRLQLIHLNDSLVDCGSRRDRHAPVGRGRIGARGMARIVRHPDLAEIAGIMETPRQTEADDRINMARAKRWRSYRGWRM